MLADPFEIHILILRFIEKVVNQQFWRDTQTGESSAHVPCVLIRNVSVLDVSISAPD